MKRLKKNIYESLSWIFQQEDEKKMNAWWFYSGVSMQRAQRRSASLRWFAGPIRCDISDCWPSLSVTFFTFFCCLSVPPLMASSSFRNNSARLTKINKTNESNNLTKKGECLFIEFLWALKETCGSKSFSAQSNSLIIYSVLNF